MHAITSGMYSIPPNRASGDQPVAVSSSLPKHGDDLFAKLLGQSVASGGTLVAEIQKLVEAGQLDRISARAVYLILNGQLDSRDLRQLLPRDRVRVRAAVPNPDAVAFGARVESPSLPTFGALETLGRYRIKGVIHQGSHGVVYRANRPEFNRPVAIKVASSGRGVAMLRHEAAILVRINHPNVLRVWDAKLGDEQPYLVSEYIPAGNVYHLLRRRGRLTWHTTWRIARDVVRGLRAVQQAGFLHGDIKPSNLLIDRRGRVILADFGVARNLHGAEPWREEICGSWPYLAPECFTSPGDIRSDMYSLGLTLYQLLTGVQPIAAQTHSECLNAHLKLSLQPPHWFDAEVPLPASELILRMAAKDPSHRPGNYGELLDELHRLDPRGSRSVVAAPKAGRAGPPEREHHRRKRSKGVE